MFWLPAFSLQPGLTRSPDIIYAAYASAALHERFEEIWIAPLNAFRQSVLGFFESCGKSLIPFRSCMRAAVVSKNWFAETGKGFGEPLVPESELEREG